jgi:hypothetical protein
VDDIIKQQVYHSAHGSRKRPAEAYFVLAVQATQGIRSQNETMNMDGTWLNLRALVHEGSECQGARRVSMAS